MQFDAGGQFFQNHWQETPSSAPSEVATKLALGLAYKFIYSKELAIRVFFRREGIFIEDQVGNTIAYSASLMGVGFTL